MKSDDQTKSILATLSRLTHFDFSQKATVTQNNTQLDQIANGINQLGALLRQKIAKKEELNKRLNYTQELANLGSWVLDFETNKMTWSKQAFEIYGKEPTENEISFQTLIDTVHPSDRSKVNSAYFESFHSNKDICELEHRIIPENKDEIKYVIEKCKFERNETGNIVRSIGFVQDITEQKKTKEISADYLNELNYYKYAIDKASIVAITDQKGIINYVNDNFCKISKYSKEELIGQDHRIINSGFHPKEFFKNIWQTIANGKVWIGEIKNKDKNGNYYWVETSIIPFLNHQGKPIQYLSIRTDITSKKQAEEELLVSNNLLEKKVNERTEEFLSVIENLSANKQLLRKSEAFSRGILNSLASHIAVVDYSGQILSVNEAWKKFAMNNGDIDLKKTCDGENYFTSCENAIQKGELIAQKVLTGIKDVINKKANIFQIEYPCHSPNEQQWFLMRVKRFEHEEPFVVVSHTDITERVLAEQKIKFHANLLSAVEQSVIATDKNGNIIYWNKESEKIYGWAENEVLGKNIFETLATPQSKCDGAEIMKVLSDGKSWAGEYYVKTKTLKEFPVYVSTSAITGETGEINGIISVSFDITERKLAEEKTIFHSNLLEAVQQSVIATDNSGQILYWNKAAEKIYGWTEEETIGKNIADIMLSDQTKEKGMAILNQLSKGRSWSGELLLQRKNGEQFMAFITHSFFYNNEGVLSGLIGVSIDLTEIVKAREEIFKSNERYNLVAKATNDAIWEYDIINDKVTRSGDGFEKLFGYEKENQNSQKLNYKKLVHPEDLEQLQASEQLAYNNPNENYWEFDYRFLKANGDYAYVNDKGYIIRDKNGIAIKMIGATQDITERVKHLNAIEEQNRKLREIAWVQSHVVRAPLSRMMGIVNVLKDEKLNSDDFKTWLNHFVESSKELDTIIRDISNKTDAIDL